MAPRVSISFTVKQKLLLGYLFICLIMVSLVFFGYRTATNTAFMLEKNLEEDVIPLVKVIQLQEQTNKIRVLEGELTQKNDIFNVLGIISQLRQALEALSTDLEDFVNNHFTADPLAQKRLLLLFEQYSRQVTRTIHLADKGNRAEAAENFRFASNPRFLQFLKNLETLSVRVQDRAEEKHAVLSKELHLERNLYLGISAFFIITGFLVVVALARSLSNRIVELRRGALEFSAGNFQHPLKIPGKDEVADLAEAFNIMRDSLRQKIKELSELNAQIGLQNKELEKHRQHLEELVDKKTQDLMQSEEMVNHFQKLESLGTLAGGIAHDFNNLLHGISGYAHLLQLEGADKEKSKVYLDQIETIAHRGAELVKRIMAFSRKDPTQLEPHSLNTIITETIQLLNRTAPKEIEIRVDLPEAEILVKVDHTQLEQVFINIANNSVDAIDGIGIIHFSVTLARVEQLPLIASGDYAVIAISDTGSGMSETVRKRIFDPFFTTKDIDKGTGLGLASAYGIITNAGLRPATQYS